MCSFHHENVIALYGYFDDDKQNPCLVMELSPIGSLRAYIENDSQAYTGDHIIAFTMDVASGMEYLSSKNLLHRDLKTANIVLMNHETRICPKCKFAILAFLKSSTGQSS